MQLHTQRLVSLGHGSFVRSDDVTAVEPIHEGRGPGRRALVWVRGMPEPLVSSRSEEAVLKELTGRAREDISREREVLRLLERLTSALERMPAVTLRLVEAESGEDFERVISDARRLLSADGTAPTSDKRPKRLRDVGTR